MLHNKQALYEDIMRRVSHIVRKALNEDNISDFNEKDDDKKKEEVSNAKKNFIDKLPDVLNNYTKYMDYVMQNLYKDNKQLIDKYKEIRQHMLAIYNNIKQQGNKWGDILIMPHRTFLEIKDFNKSLTDNGLKDKVKNDQLLSQNEQMFNDVANYTDNTQYLQALIDFEKNGGNAKQFGKGLGESRIYRRSYRKY